MLRSVIKQGSKALILIRPDPDSLASASALSAVLHKNRAAADIAIFEPIKRIENRNMVKLLHIPVLPFKEAMLASYDLVCTVDAQPNQYPDLDLPRWDIVIDHHPTATGYSCAFSDVRPDMGAVSSMMVEYLESAKVRISERIATALCYGILTDTDHFQRKMTRKDAVAFSRLFPRADYQLLRVIESKEISSRQLNHFLTALQRLDVRSRRVIMHIGAAESADIAVILADFFIHVSGIQVVAISCIASEKLVIIFRSMRTRRNVGKMAETRFSDLGSAGGHRSAARAEIPLEALPPEVKLYSYESIEKFIEKRLAKPGKPAAAETASL
jgi:nanoRNase/pAp phosphatase (c-di-AMP/oligoRNAs hydrolase)